MKIEKLKFKTRWNFKIFNNKEFKKERLLTFKNIENFYQKWKGVDLKNSKNLFLFIKDYEKLISTPPGVLDKEYLYYFLKSLLDTKNREIKKKLEEVKKLREICFEKIYLFDSLKNINEKEKNKIINSSILNDYQKFLRNIFVNRSDSVENFKSKNFSLFREKISDEIKKYKEKIFQNKNLQVKVLKKYSKLGEKALNEILKEYYKKEKEFGFRFGYYDHSFLEGFDPKISRIIKKTVISKKRLIHNFVNEFSSNKEKLNLYLKSKVSFEEAITLIIDGFNKIERKLGDFIIEHLQNGLVDVYPRKKKYLTPRNISFSRFLPIFILLNYEKNFAGLPQIIHEFAHAIHTEFLRKYNSPLNTYQSVIFRETIAMFFEILILQYLKSKFNKEAIELYITRIKIKAIFYNFVLWLTAEDVYRHYKKNKFISFNKLSKIFKKHLRTILGENNERKISKYEILLYFSKGIWWYFPYMIGAILGNALVYKFYKDKNKIFNILKAGLNKPLPEALKEINLNIYKKSFWVKVINKSLA